MVKMSAKLDEEAHNGLVSMVLTNLFPIHVHVNCEIDL